MSLKPHVRDDKLCYSGMAPWPRLRPELEHVIKEGQASEVTRLLDAGRDPFAFYGRSGGTALHLAASRAVPPCLPEKCQRQIEIMDVLVSRYPELLRAKSFHAKHTPLHYAVSFSNLEAAKWLVDKDPTLLLERTEKGETALHMTAYKTWGLQEYRLKMIEFLLEREPKLFDMKNHSCQTALQVAQSRAHGDNHTATQAAMLKGWEARTSVAQLLASFSKITPEETFQISSEIKDIYSKVHDLLASKFPDYTNGQVSRLTQQIADIYSTGMAAYDDTGNIVIGSNCF